MNNILGVDIGGTHITAALVNVNDKRIIETSRQREAVNSKGSADEILHEWASVIKKSLGNRNLSIQKMGIAMPGPFDYEQGISLMKDNAKYSSLYGLNVKSSLSDILGMPTANIHFSNDAVCFLKGELFAGVAMGADKAIGITLGTGLGTTYFDGDTIIDANLWCMPFRDSIAEEYISTRRFVNRYNQLTGKVVKGVKQLADIYHIDTVVKDLFDEFATHLASFIKLFIENSPSDLVVLGGNILKSEEFFLPMLNEKLEDYNLKISIVKSLLGEDSALLGAVGGILNESILEETRITLRA